LTGEQLFFTHFSPASSDFYFSQKAIPVGRRSPFPCRQRGLFLTLLSASVPFSYSKKISPNNEMFVDIFLFTTLGLNALFLDNSIFFPIPSPYGPLFQTLFFFHG